MDVQKYVSDVAQKKKKNLIFVAVLYKVNNSQKKKGENSRVPQKART